MGILDDGQAQQGATRGRLKSPQPGPPEGVDDPVALRTSWSPLKPGGANFRTHQLVEVGASLLRVQATVGALAFALAFVLAGLGIASIGLYSGLLQSDPDWSLWPTIPFGALFALVGALLLRSFSRGAHFDRQRGMYWRGGARAPEPAVDVVGDRDDVVRLRDVHALQLLPERCSTSSSSGRRSSYLSYELNLVLRDGRRVNITDHGALDRLRADAHKLARFLGRPLWDLTIGSRTPEP